MNPKSPFINFGGRSSDCGGRVLWRRGRDSNPGWVSPHTHFPGVHLKPLGHLSAHMVHGSGFRDQAKHNIFSHSELSCGGGGGIRTHVPRSSRDNPISSRARYIHFGTPPARLSGVTESNCLSPGQEEFLQEGSRLLRLHPADHPNPVRETRVLQDAVQTLHGAAT